ncbi:unnamed protein product [Rotaria sp. Silwood1]|nr:unnamed protein product [Rotaria sp. Silwood1]
MSSCSFDPHVMECLGPLVTGGTCVMLKPLGNLDLNYVISTIHRHRVSIAGFVTSFLYALHEYLEQTNQFHLLSSMRQIIFGGEACHAARIAPIFTALSHPSLNIELVNAYGPAETTDTATYHKVTQQDLDRNIIPIGKPLLNYACHILDEQLLPIAVNELGELYIGGRGVFAGYFGDNDMVRSLNNNALVRLPFEETLCYRTGDLCRLSETGNILYCGRADHQVKLRGQRLEIGEIEACIMRVEGVTNCVVMKQTNTRTQRDFLVAFAQSHDSNSTNDLQKVIMCQCNTQLPDYMVPSTVTVMDKLPLNVNGKIDRKQLLDIELLEKNTGRNDDM